MKTAIVWLVVLGTALELSAGGYSNGVIEHVKPMNLFPAGGEVEFAIKPGKDADRGFTVTDYYGRAVPATYDRESGKLKLGKLANGYYAIVNGNKTTSFGVVPFSSQTAAAARQAGHRFGMKVFQIGEPGVWWHRPWTWELDECVTACERLGLQWTRHAFNARPNPQERGVIGIGELVTNHQMNCVMKVEGIPESAYDEGRYGPKADFAKKKNKRGWSRCSVPVKSVYQDWLKSEIAKLPADQLTFEIGNEVWDYMTGKEFAEWCRMTVPVIKAVRPRASVGADLSRAKWNDEVVAAGGLEGLDALYIHPYSFTPMPEVRIRPWLRNYREHFERLAGRKLDLYVTEYGWPTVPADKRGFVCSERQQAQKTVRESLMLYAEGCKTLIPHWMADREQDRSEREHWFGCFRLCGEPKPVAIAHATCARMIDGSEFVGDLLLPGAETGVGSMLFRRANSWVVALWTMDEEPGTGREVKVPVRPDAVYGLMGESRQVAASGAAITLKVSADVTYLVGRGKVPAALAKLVDRTGELSETRWNQRVDGNAPVFTVSSQQKSVALPYGTEGARPKIAAWHDATALRFRFELPSDCLVENSGKLFLYFSTRPDRQPQLGDWSYFDYELKAECKHGDWTLTLGNPMFPKKLLTLVPDAETEGITWSATAVNGVAVLEVVLPKRTLRGFGANKRGLMAGQINWATKGKSWRLGSKNAEQNQQWPLWKLEQ